MRVRRGVRSSPPCPGLLTQRGLIPIDLEVKQIQRLLHGLHPRQELLALSGEDLNVLALGDEIHILLEHLDRQAGRPLLAVLTDYLRAKRLLLILDNCEHLVAACAAAADQLLHAAPQLKILASSREGLGIAGETTFHVRSFSLPDPQPRPRPEALLQCEAVRLFTERTQAVRPDFALREANGPAVAQICRRLDVGRGRSGGGPGPRRCPGDAEAVGE